jgi:hypothetical protein
MFDHTLHPDHNGATLIVVAAWEYRGQTGSLEALHGAEGEVFERLANALPNEFEIDGALLRDSWSAAIERQPTTVVTELYFELAEGSLGVLVYRLRVEL